jgi:GNAT superfamily N-acetyltransferase
VALTLASGARRATLADVAAVARLSVSANREARQDVPTLHEPADLSAPELALRLLEDLDDGNGLYVAECAGRIVGFAQVSGLMVGDGGHLVELRRLYVVPERRRESLGRQLLTLVLRDLRQRANAPDLRAWAPVGSPAAGFLEAAGGAVLRQRWRVGSGGMAVRGVIFSWSARPAARVPDHALA